MPSTLSAVIFPNQSANNVPKPREFSKRTLPPFLNGWTGTLFTKARMCTGTSTVPKLQASHNNTQLKSSTYLSISATAHDWLFSDVCAAAPLMNMQIYRNQEHGLCSNTIHTHKKMREP